jgi:hypothetical protein
VHGVTLAAGMMVASSRFQNILMYCFAPDGRPLMDYVDAVVGIGLQRLCGLCRKKGQ